VPDAKAVTCVLCEPDSDLLWLGHAGGRVSALALARQPEGAPAARLVMRWQAFRSGAVTAIARTAWGGLWTGSSRGAVRVWAPEVGGAAAAGGGGAELVAPTRELRRSHGARPHGSAVAFLPAGRWGSVAGPPCAVAAVALCPPSGAARRCGRAGSLECGNQQCPGCACRQLCIYCHRDTASRSPPALPALSV